MVKNVLIDLLNHDFESLVTVTSTKSVEVEVQELYFRFLRVLIHLPYELGCDSYLTSRVIPQQVNDMHRPIGINNILEMYSKGLLRHLRISSQVHFLSQTSLLPKDGYRASDLDMTDEESTTDNHNLLSFTAVSDISHVIDASGVVTSARSVPHSTGD